MFLPRLEKASHPPRGHAFRSARQLQQGRRKRQQHRSAKQAKTLRIKLSWKRHAEVGQYPHANSEERDAN